MALAKETALAKDRRTGLAPLQHRHFSTIAEIIRTRLYADRDHVAAMFADRLIETNPQFDRARFLAACGVES